MGSIVSKNKNRKKKKKKKSSCGPCEEVEYMRLREKLKLLQGEIHEIKHLREKECQAQKQQVKNYARKEAEWKGERKKLRDEVRRLRTELLVAKDHQEMTINHQGMLEDGEDGIFAGGINILDSQEYWQWQLMGQGSNFLVQHMREEQARRDEAVQKWKKLYLSIKTELDTLIHRAHQGTSSMSSPNDTIMPSNNISHGNVDIVPEHMLRWIFTLMVLYYFPLLRSCMNSFRVLIGHCRRLEEPVARDPEAPTTEEVERLEAGISINKKFFFVSNFLSSAASGGIFAFLQISKGKAKPTMKHIYIACSVCFATSIVVVVAGVALILIPCRSGLKSLILKFAIGTALVLLMSDSFLAIIAFNMGS